MSKGGRIPYPILLAATQGDYEAINYILKFYERFICFHAKRAVYEKDGTVRQVVDPDIRHRMETELIKEILKFEFR